ncbi:hypothetical protein V2S66_26800 [Streptomyces sp. V4-01]|uniref:Secreted protein n=1 Tax=Actinacidiphila polyblastidii TaxID=3110430 RepID=A0ABU7PJZ8_9ACTN|nr:hypothetical protein [Streptomyces sp. V4-01]
MKMSVRFASLGLLAVVALGGVQLAGSAVGETGQQEGSVGVTSAENAAHSHALPIPASTTDTGWGG